MLERFWLWAEKSRWRLSGLLFVFLGVSVRSLLTGTDP